MKALRRFGVFGYVNYALLTITAMVCILPFVHVLSVSLSNRAAADAGTVNLVPVGFLAIAYQQVFTDALFVHAFGVSVARVVIGTAVQMAIIVLAAYPLSMSARELKGRNVLIWVFFFPMLFGGGLIPTYILMVRLHLVNSFWSLIFNPGVVPIFSIILLMNFFRSLPREMYEAALVDGASHWRILMRLYLPLSLPALATLSLFSVVGLWNDWFTGLIYLNSPTDYPLQTYLEQIQLQPNFANLTSEEIAVISQLSSQALASARIIIAAVPVIVLYPFLQRYFIKGIVLGAIKG